ncbi:MAG: hypothetical protein ABSE57_21520, partial [Bryobacteraceae bacterium]
DPQLFDGASIRGGECGAAVLKHRLHLTFQPYFRPMIPLRSMVVQLICSFPIFSILGSSNGLGTYR